MALAPPRVVDLVRTFDQHIEAYRSQQYNEMQLRREFLDPLFEELGWDVANKAGYAQAYKDVIHEDAIKIGGATKAPDYCFRVGGVRKFFLEAKKPSVDIKGDPHPAYQLRRYGWSAKLPLSILTDFEEFAVYDCHIRPKQTDRADTARIMFFAYKDYLENWSKIANIFSKEAILKGSFDKFAATTKGKRGTSTVDREFLAEIEKWRGMLARIIALRNRTLSVKEINFAVQRIIDRILFLRMCEDRGIEDYGQLLKVSSGDRTYPRLCEIFEKADQKYNSGLFHFHDEPGRAEEPDELTPNIIIDDTDLKWILHSLYYPQSPYEFSVLPAEILGNVYEQFLGKVITLTAGHRATVEDKPEVKKAGGVYYTPSYIVDYIVKNTVGKLCDGKTRRQVSNLRILDPACGSGSFLIGAYQYLLDWHLKHYTDNDPETHIKGRNPKIYQAPSYSEISHESQSPNYKLTVAERKRILLNNIFGVDIDSQAVEVTKLSLLLKVLEGENQQTIENQYRLFHERALPDLATNIKCGNSLIGPDFYDDLDAEAITDDLQQRINAFDWRAEFPKIFTGRSPGLDAIIGNPPWGVKFSARELEYHREKNQDIIVRMIDSFMYFFYQSCKRLSSYGLLGMILPDVILYQSDNFKLRHFILSGFRIHAMLNMGDVFHKVTRPASILIVQQGTASNHQIAVSDLSNLGKLEKESALFEPFRVRQLLQVELEQIPGKVFQTSRIELYGIVNKLRSMPHKPLKEFVDQDGIQRGVSPDLKEAFIIPSNVVHDCALERGKLKKVLTGGKQVRRFHIQQPDLWLIYTTRHDDFSRLPNICAYIDTFRESITCKEVAQKKHSIYSLHRPRKERIFLKKKKLIGVITYDKLVIALDEGQAFATDGLYVFATDERTDEKYLMGILNSRLFIFVYRLATLEKGRVLAQVKPTILSQLPIRTIDLHNHDEKTKHDNMVKLVDHMLDLHKKLAAAKIPDKKTRLQREINTTDRQIDKLVYELYGLTSEEIEIVEGKDK